MMTGAKNQAIIDKLYEQYQANGFITEDDALDLVLAHKLPLDEIESVTEKLLVMGVLFQNEPNDKDDNEYDKSQIDYNSLFNDVIGIEPGSKGFVDQIREIQAPQHKEWRRLIPQAKNGNQYARDRIIEMYLRVVVKNALYHHNKYDIPLDDTIQDGILGLIQAVERFDPTEHDLFTTYAPWWITQNITREMQLPDNPMYFPVHIREKLFAARYIAADHICEKCLNGAGANSYCPTLIDEIMVKFDCDNQYARMLIRDTSNVCSVEDYSEDDTVFSDEGVCIEESDNNLELQYFREVLFKLIKKMRPNEQIVLKKRFGLGGGEVETLDEIGQQLGITRERVRQIEAKVLEKLRSNKVLKRYYGVL